MLEQKLRELTQQFPESKGLVNKVCLRYNELIALRKWILGQPIPVFVRRIRALLACFKTLSCIDSKLPTTRHELKRLKDAETVPLAFRYVVMFNRLATNVFLECCEAEIKKHNSETISLFDTKSHEVSFFKNLEVRLSERKLQESWIDFSSILDLNFFTNVLIDTWIEKTQKNLIASCHQQRFVEKHPEKDKVVDLDLQTSRWLASTSETKFLPTSFQAAPPFTVGWLQKHVQKIHKKWSTLLPHFSAFDQLTSSLLMARIQGTLVQHLSIEQGLYIAPWTKPKQENENIKPKGKLTIKQRSVNLFHTHLGMYTLVPRCALETLGQWIGDPMDLSFINQEMQNAKEKSKRGQVLWARRDNYFHALKSKNRVLNALDEKGRFHTFAQGKEEKPKISFMFFINEPHPGCHANAVGYIDTSKTEKESLSVYTNEEIPTNHEIFVCYNLTEEIPIKVGKKEKDLKSQKEHVLKEYQSGSEKETKTRNIKLLIKSPSIQKLLSSNRDMQKEVSKWILQLVRNYAWDDWHWRTFASHGGAQTNSLLNPSPTL